MKKVLLLIDNLDSGGAQNQMVLLAQGLKHNGYEPTVVTYFNGSNFFGPTLMLNDIEHVLIEKKDKLGISFLFKLKNFIRSGGFDLCISFMNTPNSFLAICKAVFGLNIKIIVSHRMNTDLVGMNTIRKGLLKWINKKADMIVCNSNHERTNWIKHQDKIEHKISTIYNGVDNNRFSAPDRFRVRQRKLLIVGSLSQYKNGLLILEAIKALKDSNIEFIHFHWIGRVDRHLKDRNAYAQAMFAYIEKYELSDWISFMEPTSNIQQEYHTHDGLVLASKSEGLPNVVCEALTTGMPVILSEVLDHPLLVEDGKEGFLFDPSSRDSLCDAINKLFELSNDDYIQLQKNSMIKSDRLFSLKTYIDAYIKLIEG